MSRNYVPGYKKYYRQEELAGWINHFVLEKKTFPSYNRIISQFNISRTTCYAWIGDLVARGRISYIGVPHENENLQVRTMLGNAQTNKKTESYSNTTGSSGQTYGKADDSHVGI